jgi:hypothetical protein
MSKKLVLAVQVCYTRHGSVLAVVPSAMLLRSSFEGDKPLFVPVPFAMSHYGSINQGTAQPQEGPRAGRRRLNSGSIEQQYCVANITYLRKVRAYTVLIQFLRCIANRNSAMFLSLFFASNSADSVLCYFGIF